MRNKIKFKALTFSLFLSIAFNQASVSSVSGALFSEEQFDVDGQEIKKCRIPIKEISPVINWVKNLEEELAQAMLPASWLVTSNSKAKPLLHKAPTDPESEL